MPRRKQRGAPRVWVAKGAPPADLELARREVAAVYVKDEIGQYIVSLISATPTDPLVYQGGSPRATLAVAAMARAAAWIAGRDYVLPQDVQIIFRDTVAHRLLLTGRGLAEGADPAAAALGHVKAPGLA